MRLFLRGFALLGALLTCGSLPAVAGITDYPFRLTTRASGPEQELVARNDGAAPITVHVAVTGENFASDRMWPVTAVVPPYTVMPLGRIFAAETGSAYNFLFRYSHHFGRVDAAHDPHAAYRLPFEEGQAYAITQAHGGRLTSHNNRENLYAVDFAMPPGSAVLAARAGVVIDVTLTHQEGGFDMRYIDKANTVAIVHDDGTVAEYAHLSPGAALVNTGQRVPAGALIGYSGNTGYSSGPHLHFIVSKPGVAEGKVTRLSVPIVFYGADPVTRFSAVAGTTVTANYSTPAGAAQQLQSREGSSTATGLTSQHQLSHESE